MEQNQQFYNLRDILAIMGKVQCVNLKKFKKAENNKA